MTLRSEIHSAIDGIAPPAPALPREAVAFVLSNGRLRSRETVRSESGWGPGMRRAGSLVAATVVVVMMITLVIGGRLWRDWNTQQQNAARQAHIAQLGERPLNLPFVEPGAACPESPLNTNERGYYRGYGSGPAYVAGSGQRYGLNSGTYLDQGFWTDKAASGLVLIRARDLVTNQPIIFGKMPFAAVGSATPSGTVSGSEVVFGVRVEFREELLLDPSQLMPPPDDSWEAIQGFPTGSSGCIGLQADGFKVDGSAFSEVIVIKYLLLT